MSGAAARTGNLKKVLIKWIQKLEEQDSMLKT